MKEYIRTRHSVYQLTYHMVFVTKWRKPVITDEIGEFMVATAKRLCDGYGGELISGETDGLISFEKEESLYSLLVGIKPANLNLWASRPLDKEETDCVRAAYIREHLPQICS